MNNKSIFFIFLLALFNLVFFFANLSSHIFGGDSAEYATILTLWGIAHPPGYPFFSLLGNFFTHTLPFTNLYHKVSFISFFCSTLTSLVLFYFLTDLKINPFISFFAVIFYLTLLPIWIYSIVPEVFSLAIFLIMLQIYSLFKLKETRKHIWANIFFLTIGLSFSHHHLFLFYFPAYLYFLLKNKKILKTIKKNFGKNVFFLLIGLSVYLYIPLTVYLNKVIDYENVLTLDGFFRLITRASYGTFKAHAYASSDFLNRLYDIFSLLVFYLHDFKPLGIFFILVGSFYLFYKNRFLFWFFSLSYLSVIFFFFYANFSIDASFSLATYERFLYFFYFSSIFFFAFGIQKIFTFIKKIELLSNKKIISLGAYFCFSILLVNLIYTNIKKNLPLARFIKKTTAFEDYAKNLMTLPKQKSIVFLHGDNNVFLTRHFQDIYGKNKQSIFLTPFFLQKNHLKQWLLNHYTTKPFFPKSSFEATDLQDFIEENYKRGFLVFSDKPYQFGTWIPYRLLLQYYPNEAKFNKEKDNVLKLNYNFFENNRFLKLTSEEKNIIFLKNLEDVYAEKISNFVDFFILNSNDKRQTIRKTFQIMDKLFDNFRDNYIFNRKYLIYSVKYNQCYSNTKKAANFLQDYLGKNPKDFLLLAGYFNDCEKNKQKSESFFNKFLKLEGEENYSLENIR